MADAQSDLCPLEIVFLSRFCAIDNEALNKIGYGRGSVFASSLYIASLSDHKLCLLGNDLEEEMEIREWAEFCCSQIRSSLPWQRTSKDQLHSSINILDTHLATRVYIAGGMSLSVADLLMYYGLYIYMLEASYSDKMTHAHLSRWFDQVQHCVNVKPFTWQWVHFSKSL